MGRWYEGGPPGDEPLGGARGETGLFNPIAQLPQWMRAALRLTTNELPNRLQIDRVVAAIELGQQGWAYVRYFPVEATITVADPIIGAPALVPDATVIRRLVSVEAFTDALAATLELRGVTPALGLFGDQLITAWTLTALIPTPAKATTADLTRGLAIVIPPGSFFDLASTGLVGAETITVHMLWAEFPAGFPLPL